MTKDYKGSERKSGGRKGGSSLLVGILIGLILGLGIALGVAWYINKVPSPFLSRPAPPVRSEAPKAPPDIARSDEKTVKAPESKPRFDFYKILPGTEEPATDQQLKDAQKGSTASAREAFFLQAGAFQSAPDADNLKARLALLGIEATIQTTPLPDKGVWHRVRIGPYTSVEELNRARDTLKQNGVETTLIKVREAANR
ncbi:MAG: sporulation protein [Betaproteobacteria bacterium RIFCSPLOWO2_12_FULL_62_58]|nr:MAG: sporulation protein [Betaproteobacteria bacterium RIFCSPLOWO2_02_FULL_62_79]OGA55210.1 MAG: sporulation protein [Betaproteobacteria bacterium RIFCSPLOWO2_12_FULL_62_58]